jgi:SAM-dependent methyltransferase
MRGIEQIPWMYDAMMAVAEATGFAAWRRRLVADAHGVVLDIGCGTGRNLPLYGADVSVFAMDFRIELVIAARRRAGSVPVVVGRAESLPFAKGAFETVTSGLVFCSVPDPIAGLAEIRRVLAPGGRLRMLEHVRSRHGLMARWQDLVQPLWTWVSGGCHPNRDTEDTVRRAGFVIDEKNRRARRNVRLFSASASSDGGGEAGAANRRPDSNVPQPDRGRTASSG